MAARPFRHSLPANRVRIARLHCTQFMRFDWVWTFRCRLRSASVIYCGRAFNRYIDTAHGSSALGTIFVGSSQRRGKLTRRSVTAEWNFANGTPAFDALHVVNHLRCSIARPCARVCVCVAQRHMAPAFIRTIAFPCRINTFEHIDYCDGVAEWGKGMSGHVASSILNEWSCTCVTPPTLFNSIRFKTCYRLIEVGTSKLRQTHNRPKPN